MDANKFDAYVDAAPAYDPAWGLRGLTLAPYPHFDIKSRTTTLAYALFAQVQNLTDGEAHTVVVAYQETDIQPEFTIWCGDKFLERGGLENDVADKRCRDAITKASAPSKLHSQMMRAYSTLEPSEKCSFWIDYRKTESLCVHTNALLGYLKEHRPDFRQELIAGYGQVVSTAPTVLQEDGLMSLAELAFQVPVLIEGDRGAGKTVDARAFARTNHHPLVTLPGHEGVESIDMLGYQVAGPAGTYVWKDGPLAEAFRKARQSKVVFLIDELLRIPTRQLSILLTALSPDEGEYRLRTGRVVNVVEGIAQEEELSCPCENLCIIATTNVGSEYAVDEIDPALAERFVPLYRCTTEEKLKSVLGLTATTKGFSTAAVTKCVKFYKKMAEARDTGIVSRIPTLRTLTRAMALAHSEEDIKRALATQTLLWVARTNEGAPVPEQLETVSDILDKIFKA